MSLILSGTDGLSDVDGSASTPAIRGTDTNTGIFFPAADTIAFAEGGAEVARFDSSGRLLVGGTTSYGNTVNAFGATPALDSGGLIFAGSTDSYAVDKGGQVMMGGKYRALGDYASFGGIAAKKENATDGNYAGYLQFLVSKYPSGNLERMRIDQDGNVLIGCTSPPSSSVSGVQWSNPVNVQSKISTGSGTGAFTAVAFYNGNGQVGRIDTSGSSTAYVTSSDYRLKEDVASMVGALAKVALLKPVTYKWKIDGKSGEGFIAHELAEVCQDAVLGEKDAVDAEGNPQYQGIDTSFLVATLTAAIQELKAELDSVKAELATLKA
jgi:hypothetical protein